MLPPLEFEHAFDNLDQLLRIEELYLLQRVAQKISSILELETLLDEIVGDVANTFGYRRLAVMLKEDDELVIAAGWTGELCLKGTRYKIGELDGMSGHAAATGETVYANDVRKVPFYIAGEEDTRSEIDIPLKVRGEMIGIFNIQQSQVDGFTPERIRLLESLAGHVATAISNARMFERERLEKDRMLKELDEARGVQVSLFPASDPAVEGFEISGLCRPCREVGGDWYDYIPLPDGRLGVVLADVSGKGTGAALLMSSTRSIFRINAPLIASPADLLSHINRHLLSDMPSARFVSLIYAVVDPADGSVTFANAGHLPPLYIDDSGALYLDSDSGLPLGIMENEYSEHRTEMSRGGSIFLYTDGVTEANDSSGDEYGPERLSSFILTASRDLKEMLNDIDRFAAGTPASDDVTIVRLQKV